MTKLSTRNWDQLKRKMSPAAQARVEARVKQTLASMPLAELRKAVGLTQAQLADTLDLGQGTVSKIENAADMYLSTLRRFVRALGGDLVVKASFPHGREFVIDRLSSDTTATNVKASKSKRPKAATQRGRHGRR